MALFKNNNEIIKLIVEIQKRLDRDVILLNGFLTFIKDLRAIYGVTFCFFILLD